jgi:hypothetical protein
MTCNLFDNSCRKHEACGPVSARFFAGRTLPPGWLLSSTKQLSRLSYSTAARHGILPNRPWPGSRDSMCERHIRWLESINLGGAPTRFGSIRSRQTFWKNAKWLPLLNISRSAARQLLRTSRQDRSLRLASKASSSKGQCLANGGGSSQCTWTWIRCGRWPFGCTHCC